MPFINAVTQSCNTLQFQTISFRLPPTLILQSWAPASTVLPSSTSSSSITPAAVEGTGIEVWNRKYV